MLKDMESEQHQVEQNVLSTIFLPIQRGYGDTLACNWGEGEINP